LRHPCSDHFGEPSGHGTWVYEAIQEGLVVRARVSARHRHPEPGSLSTAQAFTLLQELSALPFVRMDCVEVAPVYDHQELTSLAAAQLVWTWLAGRTRVLALTPD